MQHLRELARHDAPAGRPQPLTFHGSTLWAGCWDVPALYALDPVAWTVTGRVDLPGKPYGLTSFGGALCVVISEGEADDRYLYRFDPAAGFDRASKTACPELTGSHLASDGEVLYLAQLTNRKLLAFGPDGSVVREIALPCALAGVGFADGACHAIAADAEWDELTFATFDVRDARPEIVPIAPLSPESRGLAFDGRAWWTSHREQNEIVSFVRAEEPATP